MRSACRTGWLALPALVLLRRRGGREDRWTRRRRHRRSRCAPSALHHARCGPVRPSRSPDAFATCPAARPARASSSGSPRAKAGAGRAIAAKRLGRVKAGRLAKYRVRVGLELAGRRPLLPTRVRARGRSSELPRSRRALTVVHQQEAARSGETVATLTHNTPRYKVLAFTEAIDETHSSTSEGVDALQDLGRKHDFSVTEARSSSGVFTESNLKRYRAVVFLNTAGDVLNAAEQTAFENYYKDGGGFFGVHSAIVTEPDWPFLTDLLGTRATGPAAALATAKIKVADRVHDASKSLPEYW